MPTRATATLPPHPRPEPRPRTGGTLPAAAFTVLFLVLAQLLFPSLIPTHLVYHHRLNYEYFRDNHSTLGVAIQEIGQEIGSQELTDYYIILGDSVAYSARSAPTESIGAYLEEIAAANPPPGERAGGRPLRVFNLAQPSMQIGDIYTAILMLQEEGISTDHLLINLLYGGFVAREPFPPVVFWVEPELRRLDREAHDRVAGHLNQARLDPLLKPLPTLDGRFNRYAIQNLYPLVEPLAYRDFTRSAIFEAATGTHPKAETFDPRPWTEKPHLATVLQEWEYQQGFRPEPFVLASTNHQIFFLERIIEATGGGPGVVFYLSPVNQVLMESNVTQPGYRENIQLVGEWFADRPVTYLDLERAVPEHLFADHLHLTPEGNRFLAGLLWEAMTDPVARQASGGSP